MKLPVLCTFALLAAAGATQAGSFGGPPPFTDLSPLQSGIDGSYQATARGTNLTGVIRFAYENGVQSSIPSANSYSFYVEGDVATGGVTASITGKQLAGVLGGQDFTIPTNATGGVELPAVFVIRGNRANGQFEGQMDLEDRMSAFSGTGNIGPAKAEDINIVAIAENTAEVTLAPPIVVTNVPITIPASTIASADFTFEGVRTSVFAQGSGGGLRNDTSANSNQ